jgi:ribonuclease Z
MRRVWIGLGIVGVVVVIALGAGWQLRERLAVAGMRKVYEQALATDPIAELPDGLHVGLCGSGAPMPDPARAGPCVAVLAGKDLFVVDSGSGSVRNLLLMNLPPPRLSAAFITHYHSDHIADLGELMLQRWGGGARHEPLPIYGPPGLESVVKGFQDAYTWIAAIASPTTARRSCRPRASAARHTPSRPTRTDPMSWCWRSPA